MRCGKIGSAGENTGVPPARSLLEIFGQTACIQIVHVRQIIVGFCVQGNPGLTRVNCFGCISQASQNEQAPKVLHLHENYCFTAGILESF